MENQKLTASDIINNPPHYSHSDIEPIKAIEAWKLTFNLGNVVKYIARHKHKNGLEDLKKARWYLDREINNYEIRDQQSAQFAKSRAVGIAGVYKEPAYLGPEFGWGSPHGDQDTAGCLNPALSGTSGATSGSHCGLDKT